MPATPTDLANLSPCARAALAVGSTRGAGSVLGAARDLAKAPRGSWPETRQACLALWDAIDNAAAASKAASFTRSEVLLAADEILRAVEAGRL